MIKKRNDNVHRYLWNVFLKKCLLPDNLNLGGLNICIIICNSNVILILKRINFLLTSIQSIVDINFLCVQSAQKYENNYKLI